MEPLSARVEREGPLPVHDAVGWAVRLAKRVEELHRLGVAHGGVSANIVLSEGVACRGRGVLGDVRQAASRPAYHSPERHQGRGISPADDTWGAAVTLYLLITGRLPFEGTTTHEIAQHIASTAPAPLAVFDAGDDVLQGILDRFLLRKLSSRTTSMSAFRQALEQWSPHAAQLPPLEEGEEESLADFDDDDDDEEIATVMRDFGDVRARLAELGAMQKPPPGPPGPPPSAPEPRPVPTPGVRAPLPSAPGMRGPAPSRPGMRPPMPSSPGMRAPMPNAPGMPPAATSQPGYGVSSAPASHPGMPPRIQEPPAPSQPGGAVPYDIDDEDSDEEGATMLMDTESQDVHAAIEAALTGGTEHKPPPGWPGAAEPGGEPEGGQGTIALADVGMDFSDVPDPTGGEEPVRADAPPAAGPSPIRAAPPGFDPMADRPRFDATAAFPEGMPLPMAGDEASALPSAPGGGSFGEPAAGPPSLGMGTGATPGGAPPAAGPPGDHPPVPPPEMFIPEPEASGGGLRVALIAASIVLLLVVTAVVLLWLDRSGTIDLGI